MASTQTDFIILIIKTNKGCESLISGPLGWRCGKSLHVVRLRTPVWRTVRFMITWGKAIAWSSLRTAWTACKGVFSTLDLHTCKQVHIFMLYGNVFCPDTPWCSHAGCSAQRIGRALRSCAASLRKPWTSFLTRRTLTRSCTSTWRSHQESWGPSGEGSPT